MKLTNIMATKRPSGVLEFILEFDGRQYEAQRFNPDTHAADVVSRLHHLAARIAHRAVVDRVSGGAAPPTRDEQTRADWEAWMLRTGRHAPGCYFSDSQLELLEAWKAAVGAPAWHDPDTGRTVPKPPPISAEQARAALGVAAVQAPSAPKPMQGLADWLRMVAETQAADAEQEACMRQWAREVDAASGVTEVVPPGDMPGVICPQTRRACEDQECGAGHCATRDGVEGRKP